MIDVFLDQEVASGNIPPLAAIAGAYLLHGHCHQKSEFGTSAIHSHFSRAADAVCEEVLVTIPMPNPAGDKAGSFGSQCNDANPHTRNRSIPSAERQSPINRSRGSSGRR